MFNGNKTSVTAGNFRAAYAPHTLQELVWPSPYAKDLIEVYADGLIDGHLLLHGPFGTGKTTICKLIPVALTGDPNISYDTLFVNASDITTKSQLIPKIKNFAETMPFCGNVRFIVLDEADGLDKAAQDALKGLIDQVGHVVRFLITTNHLHKLDCGIQSRCHVQCIDHCQPMDWLPRAKMIMQQEGVEPSLEDLRDALEVADGDSRKTLQHLERLVAREKRTTSFKAKGN